MISTADVITAVGLAGMAVVSWCLPESIWKHIARLAAPLPAALAWQTRANIECIKALVGNHPIALSARDIQLECMGGFIVDNLRALKDYRPGGWNPEIQLHGLEHIEAGLRRGRGVILWIAPFTADLITKIALYRVSYLVSHLSLWRHGYSDTRFGMRFLNPIRTTIEERYLRELVVIAPDSSKAALMTLRERLRANGIISISAMSSGKRPAVVPFLNGSISLGVGAPYLAYQAKSVLLPVFPVEEDDGRFTVVIAPPLAKEGTCLIQEFLNWATREYVSLLEPYVLEKPGQWHGWMYL